MNDRAKITRRAFLLTSVAMVGGVAFGYYQYKQPFPNPLEEPLTDDKPQEATETVSITPYLLIDQNGITIITPRAEMGQGVHSTLAALVAEELDVAWDDIKTSHGPPGEAYYNVAMMEATVAYPSYDTSLVPQMMRGMMGMIAKFMPMQVTGGSSTAMDAFKKMRLAGAAARHVLCEAAAQRWNIAADTVHTQDGFVIHPDNTEKLAYTELAVAAADMDLPAKPPLKDKSQWRYLGKSMPKLDMEAKCTGTAQFGIDVKRTDMLYATVICNPHLGGKMKSYDASQAQTMRGVQHIIALENGVAVVADNTWRAFKAAQTIRFEWGDASYPATTEAMFEQIAGAFENIEADGVHRDDGDAEDALADTEQVLEVEYHAPFLAHSTMEPMNATAQLRDGELHIWTGQQAPTFLRDNAAKVVGLEANQVHLHIELLGGGFGRRFEQDFGLQAAHIAKAMKGKTIKMTWTREEDMRHDFYRPGAVGRCRGVMGRDGVPEAVQLKISSPSVTRVAVGERMGMPVSDADRGMVEGACDQPYTIPNYQVIGYTPELKVPIGFWRSVGASFNGFFHECFLDELAVSGNVDPLQMRLQMTRDFPVAHEVLKAVGELAHWNTPLPAGKARGLAMTLSFGSYVAEVVEVRHTAAGIKIDKVYCVIDPGLALDPGNIEAQMQSGIIYGLSAAVMGEITFAEAKVKQSNFHDYGALRMYQTPDIVVKILENGPELKGVGEPGTPPSKPALANAIFALTGQRIREYPLNKHVKFA